jgi:hypothetical protein
MSISETDIPPNNLSYFAERRADSVNLPDCKYKNFKPNTIANKR